MPAKEAETVLWIAKILYPRLGLAANVAEISLKNLNLVLHGPMMVLNAGWIEHTAGRFMICKDGATPWIGRAADATGDERNAGAKVLGLKSAEKESWYERIKNSKWPDDPREWGPPSLQHRYITEDIPYGLVPVANLGDLLGVSTPDSNAIIELFSIVKQVNYWKEGLTLEKLELDG